MQNTFLTFNHTTVRLVACIHRPKDKQAMKRKQTQESHCDACGSDADISSWIFCDICRHWTHTACASLSDKDVGDISSYHCAKCAKDHGPSVTKRKLKRARVKIDYVALDQGDTFALDKSMHPHVPSFEDFAPVAQVNGKQVYVDVLEPEQLSKEYILASGLPRPILVRSVSEGDCGMRLPCPREDLLVSYIAEKTGADARVEVMDVLSQQGEPWTLGRWEEYFYTKPSDRDRIRNVISLEVSDVPGLREFVRPQMVRELDLVDKVWQSEDPRPKVLVYCLMSVAKSYTDFHIDFSGTPVYYTVCLGSKTFLMFPPTPTNLELYKLWCGEPNQNFLWFAEYTRRLDGQQKRPENGFKVLLQPGDLFIIPSGWIHAVYTPEDAVIVGGNYLTLRDIPMHLTIYNLERDTHVPAKYRFPKFFKVMWLASWHYLNHPHQFEQDSLPSVKQESAHKVGRDIAKMLLLHLRQHYETSKTNPAARKSIPVHLIGKDVEAYLQKFALWLESLTF